jgi:spermidine/putrescine-binding protein
MAGNKEQQRSSAFAEGAVMRKWLVPALVIAAAAALVLWRFSPGTQKPTVVVYVSHDQVFSEPILKDFEKESGIEVRASTIPKRRRARAP